MAPICLAPPTQKEPMTTTTQTAHPEIVPRSVWLTARKTLLAREKELTRQQAAVAAQRRRLPMVRLDKPYTFDGPVGKNPRKNSLLDLFDGRDQLIVYHFMFDPADPPPGKTHPFSEGCPGCSFVADNFPHLAHLRSRGVSLVLVSRAPVAKIAPFRQRMGWTFPWYSSFGSDFNYDFGVTADESVRPLEYNYKDKATLERDGETYHLSGENPGLSVFLRRGNEIFHTWSTYARGLDAFLVTNTLLDTTPYGRQEKWEDSPEGWPQPVNGGAWWLHHDKYEQSPSTLDSCCRAP